MLPCSRRRCWSFTPTSNSADAPPTLKDAFKDHFTVGTAVNRIVTGNAFRRTPQQVSHDIALVKAQFNQITAGNDMKWALIHPREGKDGYDFGPADTFVNFGLSNKMESAGHTLVWHSQTPNWVFAGTNPPPPSATNAAHALMSSRYRAEVDLAICISRRIEPGGHQAIFRVFPGAP